MTFSDNMGNILVDQSANSQDYAHPFSDQFSDLWAKQKNVFSRTALFRLPEEKLSWGVL